MNDVELTRALERGEIANENFHHASHLHVAWVYLSESSSVARPPLKCGQRCVSSRLPRVNWKNTMRRSRSFGSIFFLEHMPQTVARAWRKSFMPIRTCWKEIFHSLIIRESGFSASTPGLLGWSLI